MDQRAGEKEERNSEDSSDHRRKYDVDAAAEGPGMNNHGESMDHQRNGGYEEAEEETAGVLKEVEVVLVGASEEEASAPLLVHPCSLLQLLLRACAGCLDLRGYCSDDDDPKPATDDDAATAAAAADSPQEGDHQGGGDKAASQEVVTQVRAVRRPSPPVGLIEGPAPVEGSTTRHRQRRNGDLLPSFFAWPMYGQLALVVAK